MSISGPLGNILIVDDDVNIADLLKFNLGSEGFAVDVVANAKDVDFESLLDVRIIIADAFNQPYTGIDLLSDLKSNKKTAPIPVLIYTSSDNEDALLDAFDNGADDFLSKPFSLRELIARVKAILRRHPRRAAIDNKSKQQNSLTVPSLKLEIDTVSQRAIEDGIVVPLTKTEYAILTFLIKNQNSFFTRGEICNEVWKDEAGSNERIVDTNISRLRKKLGESGKYIINRYGLGYAFVDKLI